MPRDCQPCVPHLHFAPEMWKPRGERVHNFEWVCKLFVSLSGAAFIVEDCGQPETYPQLLLLWASLGKV